MACAKENTIKPSVVQRPSAIYGAPKGMAGRTFDGFDYGIQGIVLHCTDMTISQYVQYLACLTNPVVGAMTETNHHYSIGSSGAMNQHIDDGNLSWTFGNYAADNYMDPPSPTISINWPMLQGENGAEVTPDAYVINIVIAKSYNQATSCQTASGLPADQHDKLIQLLVYLSTQYDIPLDADHINWHDNIDTVSCPSNECLCHDINCLITDINSYCNDDCSGQITYNEVNCDQVSHLLAIPDSCGNSNGCVVSVPLDACCFGHIPEAGEITQFVGVHLVGDLECPTDEDKLCLVKADLKVTSPVSGKGTVAEPLKLDLCAFGDFVPSGTLVGVLGIDSEGCLVEGVLTDAETPITPVDTNSIDLAVSGTSDHTLEASVKVSITPGNLIQVNADGLYAAFDCDSLDGLFDPGTIQSVYGVDSNGDCVSQLGSVFVSDVICDTPVSNGMSDPLHILGRADDMTCPLFFTAEQVVSAGLTIQDTNSVDLNLSGTNVLTANSKVDPAADNIITITANGLYVPEVSATALDDCINVSVTDNELSIGINVSDNADNILTCEDDGLYVPDLNVMGSNCVQVVYNANTRTVSVDAIISNAIGGVQNALSCEPTGLYVPRGADANVNPPLVGIASDDDPLGIDFSLLDNEDFCDIGQAIPSSPTVSHIVGLEDGTLCLRQLTGETFINLFLDTLDTNTVDLTLTTNVLQADAILSPAIGGIPNILTETANGLYVPLGGGISAVDTACVSLQLVNGILTSTLILDNDPDNQVTCNPGGLFVDRGAGVLGGSTDCISVSVVNGIITATPTVSGSILGIDNALSCEASGLFVPVGAGITVQDSDCFDVTLTGDGILSIEPIISPLIDNLLQCTVNGLYVSDPDQFISSVSVTNCLDLSVVGGVLSAQPIIDSADTNLLTCGANGLLVELDISAFEDTDCIEISENNGVISIDPIISPDQGAVDNILECLPTGLFVPVGAGIAALSSDCLDVTLTPEGILSIDIVVDPDADNSIQCRPNGLFSQEVSVSDTASVDLSINNGEITADVNIDPAADNILVENANGLYVPEATVTGVADTQCIDLTLAGGVVTAIPILSPDADNQIECRGNGFYVPNCCPEVQDTATVELTLTGTNLISADVIIDPVVDNILVSNPNGLYVAPPLVDAVNDTPCISLDITGGVLTATPIVDPDVTNALECRVNGLYAPEITVVDTNSVDLTLIGGVITADVIVDPAVDNVLTVGPDGVYVPEPAVVAVDDTNCISLSLTAGVLTANLITSALADNALQCVGDGLYVPESLTITGDDTDCISVSVDGAGVVTAEPIIDPALDNQLQCLATGLYVSEPAVTSVFDTNCIDLTLAGGVLSANPILSAVANNQVQCLGDGFYVPAGAGVTGDDTDCVSIDVTAGVVTGELIFAPPQAGISNIAQCIAGQGVYVPAGAGLTPLDTDCIDITITNGNVLQVGVIVDPAVDNLLSCGPNGLYAPLSVLDTDCIDLTILGNNTISADVILAGTLNGVDNIIQCGATGLYAPEATFTRGVGTSLAGGNEIEIDTNGDGIVDFTFCEGFCSIVADNDCVNGGVGTDYMVREFTIANDVLTVNSAPEHTSVSANSPRIIVVPGPGNPSTVALQRVDQATAQLSITNPSLCRNMEVQIVANHKLDLRLGTTGGTYTTRLQLDSSIGGTNLTAIGHKFLAPWDAATIIDGRADTVTWVETIPPGATATYTAISQLTVDSAGFPVSQTEIGMHMSAMGSTV